VLLVDVLVVLWVALFALQGAYRGLVAQALSLVGLAIGALAGSWIAPKLLSEGSSWVSIASLIGAIVGAALLGAASTTLAESPRRFLASGRACARPTHLAVRSPARLWGWLLPG
jgi:uncharacterized membrane protein YeaQ/YmgE (transglycosylase-associated protein family)